MSKTGIILNFKIENASASDPDQLVKLARNIGIRQVSVESTDKLFISSFQKACLIYSLDFDTKAGGIIPDKETIINTILKNKHNNLETVLQIPVLETGNIAPDIMASLDTFNQWMHWYGHAFNEGVNSDLVVDNKQALIFVNKVANYQIYIFLKQPYSTTINVSGIEAEPSLVNWIDNREELKFELNNQTLTINLTDTKKDFDWRGLRIMLHRPEDDLPTTKF